MGIHFHLNLGKELDQFLGTLCVVCRLHLSANLLFGDSILKNQELKEHLNMYSVLIGHIQVVVENM